MKARIWHNPRCGTSRSTLALLQEAGADVTIVEYLKEPPTRDELRRLYKRAGISPREGLRKKELGAGELVTAGDEEILEAMARDPVLIERPLVETNKGVVLARPADKVRDIL